MEESKQELNTPEPGALRPSILPKFAECRCYASAPTPSDAAKRGTLIDTAMRKALATGNKVEPEDGLTDEDIANAQWGVDLINDTAAGEYVIAEEVNLRIDLHTEVDAAFPENSHGIMDALIPAHDIVVDFKTGQMRNYREQMAAYCLAMIRRSEDDFFTAPKERYSALLVYVDQRQAQLMTFTKEEAIKVIADVVNKEQNPTACEYCDWCKHFGTCGQTRAQVAIVEDVASKLPDANPHNLSKCTRGEMPPALEEMAKDHERARIFLEALDTAVEYGKKLKSIIGEDLRNGAESRYFRYTTPKPTKKILPLQLGWYLKEWGWNDILLLFEPIGIAKFEPTWKKHMGDKPMPEELFIEKPNPGKLTRTKIKPEITQ